MKTCKLSKIIKTNYRQRKVFSEDKLERLKNGIISKGLLHPIVLSRSALDDRELLTLISGERRMKAFDLIYADGLTVTHDNNDVPKGEIPYILISDDLDKIALIEAELEENILREDLTWQEKVDAESKLHKLRLAQNPEQSYVDTAKELAPEGSAKRAQRVSRSMVTAQFLDDPEVAGARTEKEAFSIASRKIQRELEGALFKKRKTNVPHTLFHTTAQEYFSEFALEMSLAHFPDADLFDCIITDPPYGMNANFFGDAAKKSHNYDDTMENALAINKAIIKEGITCTKDQAHLYIFCDLDLFPTLRNYAVECGWEVRRVPIVWYKGARGHLDTGGILGYRRSYEFILTAWKGKAKFKYLHIDTITDCMPESDKVHAAQKPVSLYKRLLSHVCDAGESILDPCCGSGTVFKAATEMRLIAVGVEPDEAMLIEAEHSRTIIEEEEL